MTTHRARLPKLCRQKVRGADDRAYVELSGRRVYLGKFGSDDAAERYHQAVTDWLAGHRRPAVEPEIAAAGDLLIVELLDRYIAAEESHPTPKGRQRQVHFKVVSRALREFAGLQQTISRGGIGAEIDVMLGLEAIGDEVEEGEVEVTIAAGTL